MCFYQLSFLIGRVLGETGSFVPYQIVYAALWFARGALIYEIVRRLVPNAGILAYLAGVLVIVHASDGALNWVGQMNQFGMIFWLLLSVYFLVLAVTVDSPRWGAVWCVASILAVHLCLWSYESGLGLVLLAPILVLLARRRNLTKIRMLYACLYYVLPLYYIVLSVQRYTDDGASTYQETVTRSDLELGQMLSDLVFNVRASLEFWNWGDSPPFTGIISPLIGTIAAVIVVIGGLIIRRLHAERDLVPERRDLVVVALTGILLLIASFPAYLILTSSRSLWRTQFLSGIGFGLATAAIIGLAATVIYRRGLRLGIALTLTAVVAYFGAAASYGVARVHYGIWDRHRDAIADILQIAPRVKPNTVIVYTGIPRSADPFRHTLWFDLALKLAYPGVALAGEYFYADGAAAPGAGLAYRHGRWLETGTGVPSWADDATLSNTIVVAYNRHGSHLLARPPARFRLANGESILYDPQRLIVRLSPDKRALRRYGPVNEVAGAPSAFSP